MKTVIFLLAAAACAQPIKLPASFDDLAKKAKKHTEVQLDASALNMAADSSPELKKLAGKMSGVFIRSYEFDGKGKYDMAEASKLASQLDPNAWKQVMSVKEDDEFVLMFSGTGPTKGFVLIAAEPDEFSVIQITGEVGLESLGSLGALGKLADLGEIASKRKKSKDGKPEPAKPEPAKKED